MANPVIVDCGGSTRIKRLLPNGVGDLNSLLDVNGVTAVHVVNRTFASAAVVTIDGDGVATQQLPKSLIGANDAFTITSDNLQTVQLDITANNLTITVRGPLNSPPIMEAKQHRGKRRYVVINAGAITDIVGTHNGNLFEFHAANVNPPIIYATLVLNE